MGTLLVILAVVCFILAAIGTATLGGLAVVPLGLALWAGASLVGPAASWYGGRAASG